MQDRSGFELALKRPESLDIPESCKQRNGCCILNCYCSLSCSLLPLCWRLRSLCRAERQHGAYSSATAAVIHGLIAQHKPSSSESWGVVKSQKQVHQHSYPHLSDYRSCLLTPRPDVMWVSALPWCAMDVLFLGTQCISLLTVGPHVQQKEDRDQLKTVEGGIHKPMSFVSLVVSAPLD